MIVKRSGTVILAMGMPPQEIGCHLYLGSIPTFCQMIFDFTSDVIYFRIKEVPKKNRS
jgi:hypothetical protein